MKKTKKILSLVLAVLMCFGSLFITAEATTFVARETEPSESDLYWIHTSKGGLNSCVIASGNSVLPNCVGYAWGRAYEILGSEPDLSRLDAGLWFGINQNKYDAGNGGYPYSTDVTKPKLGAIACWSDSNGAGHVAVVEKINGDQITTSESGWGSARFWTKDRNTTDIRLGQKDNYTFQGYIYLLNEDKIETGDRVEFNGHYYQVFYESLDWFAAKAKCEELGGHLVTITSQEEQEFINKLLVNKTKSNYWAGATDEELEDDWKWITGEEFKYTNWNINEPNNTEYFEGEYENYLQISTEVDNRWNDSYFDGGERVYGGFGVAYFGFICEWNSTAKPTPCKHPNATNVPQLDPNCIDIGFTAGVYCNDCATWLSGHEVITVGDHKDSNGDSVCDSCLVELSKPGGTEVEKKNFFEKVVDAVKNAINNVVNFFRRLLGI